MTLEVADDGQFDDKASPDKPVLDHDEYDRSQKSKFRFKSSSSKRKADADAEDRDFSTSSRGDDHRNRHHHHRSKRKHAQTDDPSAYDDTHLPNHSSSQYPDPDTAFRESLFDALADDEGAQFWEGVYGQPIPALPIVKEGPKGELERMTDEEYAAHVRAEMYKKTHQYLIEEKARQEKLKKEREKLTEQMRREEETARRFQQTVEESLRRGRERKKRAHNSSTWTQRWAEYEKAWREIGTQEAKISWPVLSGNRADISRENIEAFFLNAPTSGKPELAELAKTLKTERVRWHPDKMQQKLGGQGADEVSIRAVTAVFQIIDHMWSEMRDKNS